ncbi:MAG: nucleotidyltransferase domain-containing protein [Thermoguttaceae bacterium]|nr:nucleotidyltransferase domain-containing protein [Thermoguttaceae bacterium]
MLVEDHEVLAKLEEIEKKHDIRILYACDMGSKAWGSDSAGSDHDLRFVYVSSAASYFNGDRKDHLECELNEDRDIYGYDLSKMIGMVKDGYSMRYIEWCFSPLQYKKTKYSEELTEWCRAHFYANECKKSYLRWVVNDRKARLCGDDVVVKYYLLVLNNNIIKASYIDKMNEIPCWHNVSIRLTQN